LTDLGEPSPSFFEWVTFDEPNGILGLTLDPTSGVAVVPEPGSLLMLGAGSILLGLRRRKRSQASQ
jgi:hypothetical protein